MQARRYLLIAVVAGIASPVIHGAPPFYDTFQTFGLAKVGHYDQTGPGATVLQYYNFSAGAYQESPSAETVDAIDLSWVDGSAVSHSVSLSALFPQWSYGDPVSYASEAALTAMYPSANEYDFDIDVAGEGTFTESFDGPDDLYPDTIPMVNNYTALQAADPSSDIMIEFDGYSTGPEANVLDIQATVTDGGGYVWGENTGNSTDTSLTIPAGTLNPGETYYLSLKYEARRLDGGVGTYFPDASVNYSWIYFTDLDLVTIPEPAAGLMMGLGLLAVLRRRRR
jgi:hypothetical protein